MTTSGLPPEAVTVLGRGDGWLVVAKPPRILVHRNANFPRAPAMLQRVRDCVKTRVYPIHRLDQNTSGCLLFATRRELAGPLSKCLSDETSIKTYVCLVRGEFRASEPVRVDTPIKLGPETFRPAQSIVERLGCSPEPRSSLLRVRPITGRNHQVRRHVRDLHHPIIHDGSHGDSRVNRWWRTQRGATRLQLHSLRLDIPSPEGGRIQVTCPLFDDLHGVWASLPYWQDACAAEPDLRHAPLVTPKASASRGAPTPQPDITPGPSR